MRPGAIRVGTSGAPSGVKAAAFKNLDGSIAVQCINSGSSAAKVSVKLNGGGADLTIAKAWVTDNTHEIAEMDSSISGGVASASLPSRSMATILLSGAAATK